MKSINPLWNSNLGVIVRASPKDTSRLFILTTLALYTLQYPGPYSSAIMFTYFGLLGWTLGERRVKLMKKLSKRGHYLTLNFILLMSIQGVMFSKLF